MQSNNDISYTWDAKNFILKIDKLKNALNKRAGIITAMAIQAQNAMEKNFDREKDSRGARWEALSEVTLKLRRNKNKASVKILQDTGRLRQIGYQIAGDNKNAKIGTHVNYGAIHNEGGYAKFYKGQVKIPQREWAYIDNDGKLKIAKAIKLTLEKSI